MKARLLLILLGLLFCLPLAAAERIIDTHSGNTLTRAELIKILSGQQYILLGERHDNAEHHRQRGELLTALKELAPTVVAEHLDQGQQVTASDNLLQSLERAGFNAKGWRWPLHQPLFQAAVNSGAPLIGGNITREVARKAVREGESALPGKLAQLIDQAPLDAPGQAALDKDLIKGHCGRLPESMLQGMRLAQRARDAAMFDTLRHYQHGTAPVILLAGNGHVRLDYGVPTLIRQYLPTAHTVSVGFLEEGAEQPDSSQYDYLWLVTAQERPDPCADIPLQANSKTQ